MRFLLTFLAAIAAICLGAAASPQSAPAGHELDPRTTLVAVLPVIDRSGDFGVNFARRVQPDAARALRKELEQRGFRVVADADLLKAVQDNKADLSDRDSWTAATLTAVGRSVSARLVMLCVVTDAHMKTNQTLLSGSILGGSREGIASVRAFVVDCTASEFLFRSGHVEGKSAGGLLGDIDSGKSREARAVVNGTLKALQLFLTHFPILAKGT